ncbi:MAG: hypothetical protein NTY70_19910 [Burkholderiales bacterium]|nr:hypothetical protein [Burkholderiales bacterium]
MYLNNKFVSRIASAAIMAGAHAINDKTTFVIFIFYRIFMHKKIVSMGGLGLFFASLATTSASAVELRCEIKVSGTVNTLEVAKSADPYVYKTLDLDGGYRFSMQYLANENKFKTYVYHESKERYVLIHLSENIIQENVCASHAQGFGLHRIYSPKLERELIFQCTPVCAAKEQK